MYVPHGVTLREVLEAGERLPNPASMKTDELIRGGLHYVAVIDDYGFRYRRTLDHIHQDQVYMRTLSFRLNSQLDARTGAYVYTWECVGLR